MRAVHTMSGLLVLGFLALPPTILCQSHILGLAFAQAPAPLQPPNGFIAVESGLTWADLREIPVHDATSAVIGEIQGVVYEDGSVDMIDALQPVIEATTPAPQPGKPTAAPKAQAPEPPQPQFSDRTAPPAGSSTNTDAGTKSGDQNRVSQSETPSPLQASPAAKAIDAVVVDVGGFLGIGAHRVAVPFKELQPFRKGTELQIFLPWTRTQLEGLPRFDPKGPRGNDVM